MESRRYPLVDSNSLGNDYFVPADFRSERAHEWRFAHFSIILPLSRNAGWLDDLDEGFWFDFAASDAYADGENPWKYGRSPGVRSIQDPNLSKNGYSAPPEGKRVFMAYYNDSRSRYSAFPESVGAHAFDVLTDPGYERTSGNTVDPAAVFNEHGVAAHHRRFEKTRGVTCFGLAGERERDFQTGFDESAERVYGDSVVYLDSMEVIQFGDYQLQSRSSDEPGSVVVSTFIILNVVAENVSSASLERISASLARHRAFVHTLDDNTEIEDQGRVVENRAKVLKSGVFTSYYKNAPHGLRTLRLLPYFVYLASLEIDTALGRSGPSIVANTGGFVGAGPNHPGAKRRRQGYTDTLNLKPARVAFAIPNPGGPGGYGADFRLRRPIERPTVLKEGSPTTEWTEDEQWAWTLVTGADPWVEVIPVQGRREADELIAARTDPWTMATTSDGLALVRSVPASAAGSRYWSLASSRYVDLVILQRRAYAAFRALSKTLRQLQTTATPVDANPLPDEIVENQQAMRDELRKLEQLQVDFMTVRQRFWIDTVPGREIDTQLLRALREDFGVADLFHEFSSELEARERIVHTQYDQLRIERNQLESERRREEAEVEAQRENAVNFGIAILAAALAGPDWAGAVVDDPSLGQIGIAAALTGASTFFGLWGISRLVDVRRRARKRLRSRSGKR